MENSLIQVISQKIYFIRGYQVMLDSDLAVLYGVETKALNQAVRRNMVRFPVDFMFQLTEIEDEILRSQIVTSKPRQGRGGKRYLPCVFTEQGVAMLSTVLRSERAALVNIEIMRTFVKLRALLLGNKELAKKLEELEKKYDVQFKTVFDAIKQLMASHPLPSRKKVGFKW